VAAARCPVDVSTYPRRHVIVVKHAGRRQTFSVHEVAHNHVEWVGGQGHYDLSYPDALRRMAEKAAEQALACSVWLARYPAGRDRSWRMCSRCCRIRHSAVRSSWPTIAASSRRCSSAEVTRPPVGQSRALKIRGPSGGLRTGEFDSCFPLPGATVCFMGMTNRDIGPGDGLGLADAIELLRAELLRAQAAGAGSDVQSRLSTWKSAGVRAGRAARSRR
jgi:hypothetical protein